MAVEASVLDLVIVGGRIWAGTGADPRQATVIVQGDPLADVGTLADQERIAWVVKSGSVVWRPGETVDGQA